MICNDFLQILGVDVVGLAFLTVYGFIIGVQFVAMIIHRSLTLLHILARAPWTCGTGETNPRTRLDHSSLSLSQMSRSRFGSNTTLLSTLPLASIERLNFSASEQDRPSIIMTSHHDIPVLPGYDVNSERQFPDETETASVVSNCNASIPPTSQRSLC